MEVPLELKTVKSGLYVGRFQPFHYGHMKAIKYILKKVSEVIIVIGSAQYSHSLENPFTAGERVEMSRRALAEEGIDQSSYCLIPVEDVNVHAIWVSHVISRIPAFHIVYSNDPLTHQLFKEAGYPVSSIPYFDRDKYHATDIRQLIIKGGKWETRVPPSVTEYIKLIQGPNRMKLLASTDKPKLHPHYSGSNL